MRRQIRRACRDYEGALAFPYKCYRVVFRIGRHCFTACSNASRAADYLRGFALAEPAEIAAEGCR
jgi:hypothetical protein